MSNSASDSLSSALRAAHLIERLGRVLRGSDQDGGLQPAQWEALRYLARANRFSRTPAALAAYLGSTRGTVSQTLIALEAKGLLTKTRALTDGRSIMLDLTSRGRDLLAQSAVHELAGDIAASADAKTLARELDNALREALHRRGQQAFGVCHTCRHFRAHVRKGAAPHHCALLDEKLSDPDAALICVEQAAA